MLVGGEGNSYAIIDLPSSKIDAKDKLSLSDIENYARPARRVEPDLQRGVEADARLLLRPWHARRRLDEGSRNVPATGGPREPSRRLTYILGEMIGELNTGHTYVGGGEYPKAERIALGLLGAKIQRDPSTATTGSSRSSKDRTGTGPSAPP